MSKWASVLNAAFSAHLLVRKHRMKSDANIRNRPTEDAVRSQKNQMSVHETAGQGVDDRDMSLSAKPDSPKTQTDSGSLE